MPLLKEKLELEIEEAELRAQKTLQGLPPLARWALIVGVIAILPAYFIAKSVSQAYWQKKYSTSILQAHPSFTGTQDLKLNNIYLTSLGNNTYSALAVVENPNLDLAADNVKYAFNFYDANGKQLVPLSGDIGGSAYFLPGQKQYLAVPKFNLGSGQAIASVKLGLDTNISWRKPYQLPSLQFPTNIPNFYQQYSPLSFVVEGNFQNNNAYLVKTVRLIFLAYDKNNVIVAISQRDEYDIQPFERRAYKQLWPNIYAQNVSRVSVIVTANTLNPNNLTIIQSGSGKASNLDR